MEVKVLKFHPKHLEVMDVRADDSDLFAGFKTEEGMQRVEQMAAISVQAVTFFVDGRVLFCAGFCNLWPGVFEVWMLPSIYIKKHSVYFARLMRRYLDGIQEDFKAHRIQTTSFDDPFHEKWMKFLGFEWEGRMKKFTHDKRTMVMYGRTS